MTSLRSWSKALDRPGLPADLLIFAVGAVLCVGLVGYFRVDTTAPATLIGDHLFVITAAKSYINGHGFRLDSQLGFPDEHDELYFPSFDLSYRIVLWLVAHLTHSPFRAVHILYIASLATMYGFAYWTLRRLDLRRWIAAIGAITSVLTPFLAVRAYVHDELALSFTVPLGIGAALLLARSAAEVRLKDFLRDPYILTAMLVAGTSGLYYAFYTAMFIFLAGVATSIGQRRWFPVLAALCIIAPLFVILVFSGYGLDLPLAMSPRFAGPTRFPFEQLVYGIEINSAAKVLSFIPKVAAGQAAAVAAVPGAFTNDLGEWPQTVLTLTILSSPFLALLCFQTPEARDPPSNLLRLIGFCALFIVFGLLFGVNGGLGYFFNLLITPEIRADERLMPFLTFAAIIVLSAAAELGARARLPLLRYGAPAAIAVVLVAGWKPYVNILAKAQRSALAIPSIHQLQSSVPAMLQAKDRARLKAVLELPVVSWPEAAPIRDFSPYKHQLPYVYDRPGSPTRWSYGANEKQPWFHLVEFETSDTAHLSQRARVLGFDGVLIQKSAYDATGLANLRASLEAPGAGVCRLYDDDVLALYAMDRSRC